MSADGRLRLGNNLNTSTAQAARMEITADPSDALGGQTATNGASGLRFTNLTSAKTPYASNPGPGVLSVDANGDVIYVPGGGGGVNLCAMPVNNVTKNVGGNALCATSIYDLPNLVGINTTAPNDALEVGTALGGNGNIDVSNSTSAYKLGNTPIMWHKGMTTNFYAGVMAADNVPLLGGGNDNTVVGQKAAAQNVNIGTSNTIMGSEAAYTSNGQSGTFIGYKAGYNTGVANNNTYVGAEAGANGLPGVGENVLIGWRAGYNIGGLHNVCIGNNSGANNSGYQNTFVGLGSGINCTGQNNVAIGGNAGPGVPSIGFSSSIGAGSSAMASNTMILGDNTINAGIGLSGVLPGPQNKLELNTTTGSPYFGSVNGSSGLRFRNMTNTNTPMNPLFDGVLSVDANGDVILVKDKTGSGPGTSIGNYCGNTPAPLAFHYQVPTNNFNYYFTGDIANRDKVNIGHSCNTVNPGKLNVTTASASDPNNTGNSYTIYATNTNGIYGATNTGVYGSADNFAIPGTGMGIERGVWGYASGESDARGVYGQGGRATNSYGGYFEALAPFSNTSYGVYAEARNGVSNNYGIYATVGGTSYNGSGPDWAGYFNGDVYTTSASFYPSDKNLKKDIETMDNSLSIISRLRPVTYHYDVASNKGMSLPGSKQYGFISQEVKEILPELTKVATHPAQYDAQGKEISAKKDVLALNYTAFIPILAKGIQEQQAQILKQEETIKQQQQQIEALKALVTAAASTNNEKINELEKKLAAFGNELDACCQSHTTNANNSDGAAHDQSSLSQNVPNPTDGESTIAYHIAGMYHKAFIGIYDLNGREIKRIALEPGTTQVRIEKGTLRSGQYVYSLIVDHTLIDSKKMIVVE